MFWREKQSLLPCWHRACLPRYWHSFQRTQHKSLHILKAEHEKEIIKRKKQRISQKLFFDKEAKHLGNVWRVRGKQCAWKCPGVNRVIHSMCLRDIQAYAPIQPHIRQTPVECNHVTGHQIELVNLKELFHFLLVIPRDVDCLAHFPRAFVAPRYRRCNHRGKTENISDEKPNPEMLFFSPQIAT